MVTFLRLDVLHGDSTQQVSAPGPMVPKQILVSQLYSNHPLWLPPRG